MAVQEIELDGAERKICRECVDDLRMGGKPEKLKMVQHSTILDFSGLPPHPKVVNTVATNFPLRYVQLDLMHSHIPPPDRRGASAICIPSSENQ